MTGGVIYIGIIWWNDQKGAYSAANLNAVEIVGLY